MNQFLLFIVICLSYFSNAQNLTANFSANQLEVCLGEEIAFTDLSTPGAFPITIWNWDFGDGFASSNPNPTHIYTSAGTYNVTLTVQASNGTSDVEIKLTYIIVHPLPTVGFTLNSQACSVPFNATFTNNSSSGAGYTYAWNFGNGQTSATFNPVGITYNSVGTYDVSLIVTNITTGCVDTLINQIQVANFVSDMTVVDSVCALQSVSINDASTIGVNNWDWNFGDGGTSSSAQNNHTYGVAGTYTITLNSGNSVSGCSGTVTQTIVVMPLPVASFTVDQTIGCNPTTVTFTNTSTGGTSFSWTFGDGATAVGMNPPPHIYSTEGSFNVQLIVTNDFGCSSSSFQPSLVTIEHISVGYLVNPSGGCDPLDVDFTDTTSVPNPPQDPIVNWLWDFGNGNTYSGQFPPTETYNLGLYDVSLTVTTASGCTADTVIIDAVTVGIIDTVGFTNFPIDVCAKVPVDFANLTVISAPHNPNEVEYFWEFGDGGTSEASDPSYSYSVDTGYFEVQLIVDFRGCLDTAILTNAVHVNAPISKFSLQTLFCNPTSFPINVAVTDNSIIGELPDDAEMIWDWGDGTFTNFDDPDFDDADLGSTAHIYTTYGTYSIEQVIHNYTTGCSDSSTSAVTISYIDADFSFTNDSVCLNSAITINDISTSSDIILWDSLSNYYSMGNGDTLYQGGPHNYVYPNSGTYDIIHLSTNSSGCIDYDTLYGMDVLDLPIASATPSTNSGCAPLNVVFSNNSITQGNGTPLDYFAWEFYDATVDTTYSVGQTVSDLYLFENSFTTTMTAVDEFGCISTPAIITVDLTRPTADFTVDSVVCDLENFTSVNLSTGNTPISYEWYIDGNSVGTSLNYSSQFDEVSSELYNSVNHTITLVVTDVNGCLDTLELPIVVSMPHADANFSFSGATINALGEYVCPPVFASLTDSSSSIGTLTNWNWTFGNGNNSTLQNPQNTYVFAGTYTSTLSVTDQYGCVDDTVFTDYVTINGPSGDPTWTDVGTFCDPEYEFFVQNQNGVTNAVWSLGNGDTISNLNAFNYIYDTSGVYLPTVIISDGFGCEIPYQLPLINYAHNVIDAFFTASMLEGESTEIFLFDDASTSSSDPIINWHWDYGESSFTNFNDADVEFGWNNLGYQNTTLTVSDANGCFDSFTIQVLITANFVVPNVFSPNGDGVNEYFMLDFDVFKAYDYVILNRWGDIMIEATDHSGVILWDGYSLSGKEANEGVYFYKITGTRYDEVTISVHGHVTLVR